MLKIGLLLAVTQACWAYDTATHEVISAAAFDKSSLGPNGGVLERLGLQSPSTAVPDIFPTSSGTDEDAEVASDCHHSRNGNEFWYNIQKLIACGSRFEDAPLARPINHFMNPQNNGAPLTLLGAPLPNLNSPDFALGTDKSNNALSYPPNTDDTFSYRAAQGYLYEALTDGSETSRRAMWGKTFQTLGQVLHHLEDMAQPQHVRNDEHLDLNGVYIPGISRPSAYEKYSSNGAGAANVSQLVQGSQLPSSSAPADTTPVYPLHADYIQSRRDFWSTPSKTGIADFTSRGFVSACTNFNIDGAGTPRARTEFPQPAPLPTLNAEPIEELFNGNVPPFIAQSCAQFANTCSMDFVQSIVTGPFPDSPPSLNRRAAAISAFTADLTHYGYAGDSVDVCFDQQGSAPPGSANRYLSLNSLTFDSTLSYVIPEAVAYAAGMINYFFRGALDIALPPQGVYAVISHIDPANCSGECGFGVMKLIVKNTTLNDALTDGTVVAVAKYHLNTAHTSDLSHEGGTGSRSLGEEISVSNTVQMDSLASGSQGLMTFTFPTPIPVNATDLNLQVVFRGNIGNEQGAIAVGGKDISEPTYVTIANNTDLLYLDSGSPPYSWVRTAPTDIHQTVVSFDGGITFPVSASVIQGGQYARLVYLSDAKVANDPMETAMKEIITYQSSDWGGEGLYATYEPVSVLVKDPSGGFDDLAQGGVTARNERGVFQFFYVSNGRSQSNTYYPTNYCDLNPSTAYCHTETLGPTTEIPFAIQF